MLIHSIRLDNILSFGGSSRTIPLQRLNVLIGPNGAGKSNVLEAIELIKAVPKDLYAPIRDGGGVRDWLWKGSGTPTVAAVEAVFDNPKGPQALRYRLAFTEVGQRFEIVEELIENESPQPHKSQAYFYYHFRNQSAVLNVKGDQRRLQHEDIDPSQSIAVHPVTAPRS